MNSKYLLLSVTIAATIVLYATGLVMLSRHITDLLWSTASIRTSQGVEGLEMLL